MRLRSQEGFGLIELLMAMVMLNIGILAIVAAFNSGAVTLNRASRISTAAALADQQMELYRAIPYASIALDASTIPGVAYTYTTRPRRPARTRPHERPARRRRQRVQCQPLDRRGEQPRPQALPGRHVHHSLDDHDQPADADQRPPGEDRDRGRPRRRRNSPRARWSASPRRSTSRPARQEPLVPRRPPCPQREASVEPALGPRVLTTLHRATRTRPAASGSSWPVRPLARRRLASGPQPAALRARRLRRSAGRSACRRRCSSASAACSSSA